MLSPERYHHQLWSEIAQHIRETTGRSFELGDRRSASGGCINQAFVITGVITDGGSEGDRYFIKLNRAGQLAMFEAEALGLRQMAAANAIRVPRPICYGIAGDACYLVMEYLALGSESGEKHPQAWAEMGRQLARLHRLAVSHQGFGWQRNNTIGSTPQINDWTASWSDFWVEHRMGYQLQLGRRQGGQFPLGDRLLDQIPTLLRHHTPEPSLVHGDLWSGNAAVLKNGTPTVFDPAAYYGDREVDLAMTELFGGFPPAFYQGYTEIWPLDPGYQTRKKLYNLYHILNHFNLFGGSYGSQANRMIEQLLG
jgi:fructosamine-3-kinase